MRTKTQSRQIDSSQESNISPISDQLSVDSCQNSEIGDQGKELENPIIAYYYGLAVGARAGVCPQWHVQASNYLGKDYYAEKEGDELVVTISVDDFSRTNAERARRKAMDEVSSLLAECKGLEVQVENTRRARALAFAELERLEPGQTREREVKELVLESWDKTLEEVTPRLDAIREALTKAEGELAARVSVEASTQVVRVDLGSFGS